MGVLLLAGVAARYAVWEGSGDIRAVEDMRQRWQWGADCAERGVVTMVNEMAEDLRSQRPLRHGRLDYMPLRLLAKEGWYRINRQRYPGVSAWRPDLSFNLPLLLLNALAEAVTALLGAWLVLRAGGRAWQALACAGMIWLNPTILVVGYGLPQWDCWTFPFCLAAVLAASRERWWLSGLTIAVGVMIKGQVLAIAPFFLLLPIFNGQWRAAGGWLLGFAAGGVTCLLPWLLQGNIAPVRVGLLYGAEKFESLARLYCLNLPMMLEQYFHFQPHQRLFGVIPVEGLLVGLVGLTLAASAWFAARVRSNGWAFMLAAAIPWLGMYLFTPRIISRYMIWPVVLLSVPAVMSRGVLGIWLLLSLLGALTTILPKLQRDGLVQWSRGQEFSARAGWMVLACLLMLLVKLRGASIRQHFEAEEVGGEPHDQHADELRTR